MDAIQVGFNKLLIWLCHYLPMSPFSAFIQNLTNYPYLKYLNWFFPVTECIVVLEGYLIVLSAWVVYRRLLKIGHLL